MAIRNYLSFTPQLGKDVYVDEAATVIGKVWLEDQVSIWPGAVLRGDVNDIRIGARSNIQDLSVLHTTRATADNPKGSPVQIGEDVTVGHSVTLHGCTIGNRVLVGMGSIILDDAVIEDDVIIGAGSLVPPRKHLKSGYLYLGSPVKEARPLTEEERKFLRISAQNYIDTAADFLKSI
ncbi:carnitine operon protein CaiE [Gallibacterium anatis]|uniref:Carnitine operon protein CaiE n=1 Tax=Gallibacterium anatis TaxID=750 RepID=A0A377H340_9PAST|nr:gamma carbonic anhydrase family protein [Gallibacterium anatis]KGQ54951.1 anhydrase [Gallibacterium anatis DSM 16844 = F 149]STO36995.1 carnitine operon protein CaiE [Gallibacterium anatis]